MKKLTILFLMVLLNLSLFSQADETVSEETVSEEIVKTEDNNQTYILDEIIYEIKGKTNTELLEKKLEYNKGMTFSSLEEVELFVAEVEQKLHNLRYYEEIKVTKEIEGTSLKLNIYLDEAWGLIPFAVPKANSESGLRASLKLFWYNSLGSLADTNLIGGFNISKEEGEDNYIVNKWDARLSINKLFILNRYYDLGIKQALEKESKLDTEWSFYSTKLDLGTTFNITENLDYTPNLSLTARYNYKAVNRSISEAAINEVPLRLTYSHGLGRDDVDWKDNFRDGVRYGIRNRLHLVMEDESGATPSTDFTIHGAVFKTYGNLPFYTSNQLIGIVSINEELLGLGDFNRGVESGDMFGEYGLFLNNNIYISTIKIDGVAEAIFAPAFDIGITEESETKYGTGADFILYINKLKSLVARGTIAWDITDGFDPMEFEFDITSSLYF